jgi:ATP-dependent Lhr-like helicase
VAVVRLLLAGFVEPAGAVPEVASTLVHQILSVIAERGGIRPKPLFVLLCGPGPFSSISSSDFAGLLRHLATKEIRFIEQAPDGTLMLSQEGEKTVQSRSFFAVFESGEEWRLTVGGRTLGTLPITYPVHKDGLVVFAGQRWIVQDLDEQTKTLVVAPHPGGVVPRFEPSGGEPAHDRLIAEMRAVYLAKDVPPYLDDKAQELLAEGRETFRQLQLERRSLAAENRDVHIFLWRGSQATAVFSAALAMAGLKSGVHDLGVSVSKIKESELMPVLQKLAGMGTIDPATVAEFVANIQAGKFREVVPEDLARTLWARRNGGVVGGIASMAGTLN